MRSYTRADISQTKSAGKEPFYGGHRTSKGPEAGMNLLLVYLGEADLKLKMQG